jgi:protease-4
MLPVILSTLKKGFMEIVSPKTSVGLIDLDGFLWSSETFVKQINSFVERRDIKGILLRINSPGGAPGPAQIIFSEILKAREKKPVVAMVENTCASGGYYVAMAANKIVAPASALIGSIGAFTLAPNVKALAEDWKVDMQMVWSGKYKIVGNPFGDPQTTEERAYRQQLVDDIYDQFMDDVSSSRGIKRSDQEKWADGKVFTGRQALKLDMIDEIGDWTKAKEMIKKLAGITREIRLIRAPRPSAFAKLMGAGDVDSSAQMLSMDWQAASGIAKRVFGGNQKGACESLSSFCQPAVL